MPCASGKTFTVRRDLVNVAKTALVVVVTCNRLFTKAGDDNVFCYLDGIGKGDAAKDAKRRLKEMCERRTSVLFVSIESFLVLNGITDPATVGAMVLEETCELASKMLSATCLACAPFGSCAKSPPAPDGSSTPTPTSRQTDLPTVAASVSRKVPVP